MEKQQSKMMKNKGKTMKHLKNKGKTMKHDEKERNKNEK